MTGSRQRGVPPASHSHTRACTRTHAHADGSRGRERRSRPPHTWGLRGLMATCRSLSQCLGCPRGGAERRYPPALLLGGDIYPGQYSWVIPTPGENLASQSRRRLERAAAGQSRAMTSEAQSWTPPPMSTPGNREAAPGRPCAAQHVLLNITSGTDAPRQGAACAPAPLRRKLRAPPRLE